MSFVSVEPTSVDTPMLKLAAKAGGLWFGKNPLEDDGEALRLLIAIGIVDLGAELNIGHKFVYAMARDVDVQEPLSGDVRAAVRRAIVRMAAEIGKAMK